MHPIIRVLLFIIYAINVSRIDLPEFFIAILILLPLAWMCNGLNWSMAFRFLKRLRWLFLSILLLYAWFTPGQALFNSQQNAYMPTYEGLQAGLLQVSSLILIIMALVILIADLSRERMLAAIYWWSFPVSLLGISRERLVVRLVLAMSYVPRLQTHLSDVMKQNTQANVKGLRRIAAVAGSLFQEVQQKAEQAESESVTVACLSAPPLIQWLYPLFVACVFVLFNHFSPGIFAGL